MKRLTLLAVFAMWLLASGLCAAADAPVPWRTEGVLACPQVAAPPVLDGKLDDAVWARGPPHRAIQW